MRTACPGVFRSRSKYVAKQQEIGAKPAGLKDAHKVRVYFLDSVPRPWHAKLDAKLVWPTCRHHDIQILCVSRSPNNAKTRYLRYLRYLRYRNSARNGATNDFFAFLGQKPLLFVSNTLLDLGHYVNLAGLLGQMSHHTWHPRIFAFLGVLGVLGVLRVLRALRTTLFWLRK